MRDEFEKLQEAWASFDNTCRDVSNLLSNAVAIADDGDDTISRLRFLEAGELASRVGLLAAKTLAAITEQLEEATE